MFILNSKHCTEHMKQFVVISVIASYAILVAPGCSDNAGYSFEIKNEESSVALVGGRNDIHVVVAEPYLTFNFGFGDPHVSITFHHTHISGATTVRLPTSPEDKGIRVTAFLLGIVFSSEDSRCTGYVDIQRIVYGSDPGVNLSIDATLYGTSDTLRIVGNGYR